MKLKNLIPVALAAAVLIPVIFTHSSCANTTQAPSGGPKDSLPPYIIDIKPLPGTFNVPVSKTKIVFTFNEYVTIKDQKSIYLSPPLSKPPKARIMGKSLVVSFEEDLLPNTTYALDLTGAIADNNEGNMYPGYTYAFSTGDRIDSLYITGIVQDCNTLKPVKGATVMVYKNHADSAIFLERPCAAVRTDDWGYFALPYLQDTVYRLYALKDDAGDNIYDPQSDLVAFCDSLVRPTLKVNDTIPELLKYEMKDTAACLARKTEYTLNLFRERPTKQLLMNKVRLSDRSAYVTFMAPDTWIDSLWIRGYADRMLISQFNIQQDCLEIWVNDRRPVPDTLHLFVNYRKTDTTGALKPSLEHVKLFQEGKAKKKNLSYNDRKNIKHEDTICVFKLQATPETVEQYGFDLEFNFPIIRENFDSLRFIMVNPKQQESTAKLKIERDPLNLRHYNLKPETKLLSGWEYKLKVPHRAFRDINGYWSDSTEVKVSLPKDEHLSQLILELSDVDCKLLVDLLDEGRSKVLRSYIIESNSTLDFPYLKKGRYCVRLTEDINRNSIVDTGSLLEHRQPERVRFLKVDDKIFLDIPESAELTQKASARDILND
ncbi:MAG: Ig-like domain-containing protein [Bacteroidales bacterium]|nr:Ig-like domain-containing protein [Bacteroidales bacterium]